MRATIPEAGRPHDELLETMAGFREGDADYAGGRTWSMVYYAGDEHHALMEQAHNLFLAGNALNPIAFKSLKRMETEVVQMTASMLNAPPDAVGTMTQGGTESLLLAVKTYRDLARARRPWIRRPNMVVPETIHVAFDKAAHYFGVDIRRARVDARGQADVRAMKRLINQSTIFLGASAPQYPSGSVDPIAEIGALAARRGLPFHVDACFGGFILPWLEQLGVAMPVWDFRVPGVTSMSADLHKFGYAAKGASTIVYRDMGYLRHQFFVATDWCGGIYISPTMAGTRPGGAIAAAWAALQGMGRDGYLALAEQAWQGAERLRAGIGAIEGLRVMGMPHSTVVTWTADGPGVDIFAVADLLQERGWGVDRQQRPASVHCTVNASNLPVLDTYLDDLREAVAHVKAHPELSREGDAAVYGLMARVPLRGLVKREVLKVMETMYGPEGGEVDLSADAEGDKLAALVRKYGDPVFSAIDRVVALRDRARDKLGL
ncbi:MAG: aspartate aminotransferase family protein [Deltaproteobacteria bacterium]|nr:aspartate aminotransferase family protein [Deltaproteobacteria bacterium]MCB9788669.1 aspartate aminotransferase family protein [Deltaproteobacteria bacterium]